MYQHHVWGPVITAGLVTSVCVLLTTASAAQLGFLTAAVGDCCADDDRPRHEHALDSYPFIFERTTVDALASDHVRWIRNLAMLAEQTAHG